VSLQEIFDRFKAPGSDWLPDDVPLIGPDDAQDTGRAPRITWTPAEAVHTAPRRLGGGPGDDGEIMQRQWSIKVEVWGIDLTATEKLTDQFLASAHELLSAAGYKGGREIWNPGGRTASGSLCVIVFQLQTPVRRMPKPARPVTQINATPTLVTS